MKERPDPDRNRRPRAGRRVQGRNSASKAARAAASVVFAVCWACTADDGSSVAAIVRSDSAGIVLVQNDLTRLPERCAVADTPRVAIGAAEGEDADQLYRVFGSTMLSDGRIALVNQGSNELRIYGADGNLDVAAGREGGGPGEFTRAYHLWALPGDTIWVGDYRPWEFEVFTPSGTWVRQVRPLPTIGNPPDLMGVLGDGRAVLGLQDITGRGPGFQLDYVHVMLHAPDGGLLDTLRVSPHARWGQLEEGSAWLYPWFEAATELAARGERFVIGHGSTAELQVYAMDPDPRLERVVRWTGIDRTIRPADLDAARAEVEAMYADVTDAGVRTLLVEPQISDRRPVAEEMPVMADLRLSDRGDIWVQEYARPGDAEPNRWIHFDAEGRFACRLVLPNGLEVFELGDGYVLGKREDALGVEQVVLFDVASPGSGG